METKTTPPPQTYAQLTDIPDYYLGCLVYYDEFSEDRCRWVVYDGLNKIRCFSRASAIDYIVSTKQGVLKNKNKQIVDARLHIDSAINLLRDTARASPGPLNLQLERISARLRPFLVELDNILI